MLSLKPNIILQKKKKKQIGQHVNKKNHYLIRKLNFVLQLLHKNGLVYKAVIINGFHCISYNKPICMLLMNK